MCYVCAVVVIWTAGIPPASVVAAVFRHRRVCAYARDYGLTQRQARDALQRVAHHHGTSLGAMHAVVSVLWPWGLLRLLWVSA
jgi:hypothetical protein